MNAIDENTKRRFLMYYPIDNVEVIEQVYIGDMETIFTLSDGSKVLYDESCDGFMQIKRLGYITDEMWLDEFTRKLRKKITLSRIPQKEIAESTGVSENSMSRYLNGKTIPNALVLRRLADCLRCSIEELTTFDYLL